MCLLEARMSLSISKKKKKRGLDLNLRERTKAVDPDWNDKAITRPGQKKKSQKKKKKNLIIILRVVLVSVYEYVSLQRTIE
jgi:hypothetical protein